MTSDSRSRSAKARVLFTAFLVVSAVVCFVFVTKRYGVKIMITKRFSSEREAPSDLGQKQLNERWHLSRDVETSGDPTARERDILSNLAAVGYLAGYEPAPNASGVLVNHPVLASRGYNFYTSGHGPEAILTDMDGKVLHTWRYQHSHAWPKHDINKSYSESSWVNPDYWRRAALLESGDLLAVYEGLGLVKLDKSSNLLWKYGHGVHHDFDATEDGKVFVLTRKFSRHPNIRKHGEVVEDFITVLNENGQAIKQVSIIDAFKNSLYASLITRDPPGPDFMHTNTLEVLDGRLATKSNAFKRGNILVSSRFMYVIAVVDLDREAVVWALTGMWKGQHQPTVLDNGNMLLFDNWGHGGFSKVIEFDPFTQEIAWSYKGDQTNGFVAGSQGSNQRLPNGNTLITESTAGRAFEVTQDNKIVWEFVNPRRAGESHDLIAVIPEMIRMRADFPLDWLESRVAETTKGTKSTKKN